MNALTAICVLGPLAFVVSPLALQAGPGNKTMRVYSARMETLFIRLDVNSDGRLDASEVQGRRGLSRRLKRQNNRSYLLLEDLRLRDSSPSGPRLKQHFSQADLLIEGAYFHLGPPERENGLGRETLASRWRQQRVEWESRLQYKKQARECQPTPGPSNFGISVA